MQTTQSKVGRRPACWNCFPCLIVVLRICTRSPFKTLKSFFSNPNSNPVLSYILISSHLSLNHNGRWGTSDDFATSFLYFSLFATALWDLANSRPVHSLMLSSHLFLSLRYLLCARSDEPETWPYLCSLRLFTMARRSSCGPITCWILARLAR